jgi:hypothetical protein
MKLYGISADDLRAIVDHISSEEYEGNLTTVYIRDESNSRGPRCSVRLRVHSSREAGARSSASGRRSVAACWHTVRDVLKAVYLDYPDVRVVSGLGKRVSNDNGGYTFKKVTYKNSAHFEATFPDTKYINVGSEWYPSYIGDNCEC